MLMKLIGMLMGRADTGAQGNILGSLTKMLAGGSGSSALNGALGGGGLNDILGKFRQAGMGSKVDSWTGSGANEALTGKEVKSVLGNDGLAALAKDAGVSKRQAADGLGRLLPQIADKATPNGQVDRGTDLSSVLGGLMKSLG